MSTLQAIHDANMQEEAGKAYRYYECTGNLQKALNRFRDTVGTRVEQRLVSLEYRRSKGWGVK